MYPTMIREHDRDVPTPEETKTATFALGCFWGPDAQFGAMDGVVRTRVGYAGGTKTDPTYHALGDHTEALQVDFDPERRSYDDLLRTVFESHDPDSQVRKRQYQSAVFWATQEQRDALEAFLERSGRRADSIETRVEPIERFYLAENYHQKYSLRSDASLMEPFEEAGYDDERLRESPAAAKLNGAAAGYDVSETHAIGELQRRTTSGP
jgi:peptide-methionine (S)-S-oxide reductase